ncbi:MAG: metallophosphoesterase family protein [Acidimicrobiales bacterium]
MTTWFTADLHLGHANIIGYCGRPFPDVAAMDKALIDRWNDTVEPADTVWVLGDVAPVPTDRTPPVIGGLTGRKHLVAGNHDRCWAGHGRRSQRWVDRYLDAGFDEVHQGEVALDLGGVGVLACHFPYVGDSHDHDRYVEHRPTDRGQWLLHGHVHERWRQWGRMINVGVDVWDYRPVRASTLAEIMANNPAPPGGTGLLPTR